MQDSQSNNFASDGEGHKFCYVSWEHGANSKVSVYYLDTPDPLDDLPDHVFQPKEELRDFIDRLKRLGWQQFMWRADPEVYVIWLMRLPALDSAYEYCVFSCSIFTNDSKPPRRRDLYHLGERNDNLVTGEMWRLDYNGIVQYLEREQWEFAYKEEYVFFKLRPTNLLQLRFYRRPLV
jgi:hypothetical protein